MSTRRCRARRKKSRRLPRKARRRAAPQEPLPTGAGVKTAIIDTCVEGNHDELKGASPRPSTRFRRHPATVSRRTMEPRWPASSPAMTSSMARRRAPRCCPLKPFPSPAEENEVAATSREIALSMDWAAKAGAQVMNLSFACPADPLIERIVAAAYRKGIGLVAAAGNAGPSFPPLYPAAYPEAIAVTATNRKRQVYRAANRGKQFPYPRRAWTCSPPTSATRTAWIRELLRRRGSQRRRRVDPRKAPEGRSRRDPRGVAEYRRPRPRRGQERGGLRRVNQQAAVPSPKPRCRNDGVARPERRRTG